MESKNFLQACGCIALHASLLSTFSPLGAGAAKQTSALVTPAPAPAGVSIVGVEWIRIAGPSGSSMLGAVARPHGAGPFPAVLILHGTHGFAQQYVRLAKEFANHGVLAVAACWFSGGSGAGSRFITRIECPDAPPLSMASSPTAQMAIAALVAGVRQLPGTDSRRLALFGHSRGAGAALNYILRRGDVSALVIDSAGYPDDVISKASQVTVPVLIFHGTLDSPADGGSEMTSVQRARTFEAALRREQRTVEAQYYDAGHNGIFTSSVQFTDAVRRAASFLRTHPPDSGSLQHHPPSGRRSPNQTLQPTAGRFDV